MQSDCNRYRDLLWSYVAKELSDSETQKINEHLQGCPSCRQEAEELALIVASLNEEVPLPANFSQELHEKLISVSEEMATGNPSLKEKLFDGLKNLPRSRTFRTLAPALICLVLVVGVFSSGLFERWKSSDDILTDPSPSPVSVDTEDPKQEDPVSSVTPKGVTPDPGESSASSSSASVTKTESAPVAESKVVSDVPMVVSEADPVPADAEHIPAPASMEDNRPGTFAIPRHRPVIVYLNVENAEEFLNAWQDISGFDWSSAVQDVIPEELIAGVNQNTILLKLNRTSFESLMVYAEETEPLQENQGEMLIVIAGNEE